MNDPTFCRSGLTWYCARHLGLVISHNGTDSRSIQLLCHLSSYNLEGFHNPLLPFGHGMRKHNHGDPRPHLTTQQKAWEKQSDAIWNVPSSQPSSPGCGCTLINSTPATLCRQTRSIPETKWLYLISVSLGCLTIPPSLQSSRTHTPPVHAWIQRRTVCLGPAKTATRLSGPSPFLQAVKQAAWQARLQRQVNKTEQSLRATAREHYHLEGSQNNWQILRKNSPKRSY